jgi:hypothetical protein
VRGGKLYSYTFYKLKINMGEKEDREGGRREGEREEK